MPKVSPEHRARQRDRILDAAAQCFARKGFRATSMADIVAEADSSPGAIYRYFSGKAEIVAAIADQRHAHEALLAEGISAGGGIEAALHQLIDGYVEWLKDPAERTRRLLTVQIWAEALHDPDLASTLSRGAPQRQLIAAALRSAEGMPDGLDPDAVARVMMAIVQGLVLQLALEPDVDVDAYAAVVHSLIDAQLTTG